MLEAHNGREALAEMHAGSADLVVLDLMMPGVSGIEVLRVRAADSSLQHIPMIVISANDSRQVKRDVLDQDVCAVFAKPFDLDALLKAVTTCLEHSNVPAPMAA